MEIFFLWSPIFGASERDLRPRNRSLRGVADLSRQRRSLRPGPHSSERHDQPGQALVRELS